MGFCGQLKAMFWLRESLTDEYRDIAF